MKEKRKLAFVLVLVMLFALSLPGLAPPEK